MLYIYLATYFIVLFAVVILVREKDHQEDFLIGDRNRPMWQITMSKFAASIGVGWFITYTAYAYEFGIGVFAVLAGLMISFLFFAYVAIPKFYNISRENNLYTQGDLVEYFTKSKLSRTLIDWHAIVTQAIWILLTIVGGGKVISHFGFLSYEMAVILTALIVLSYILISGFKAVIITDVFQGFIIFILLSVMGYVMVDGVDLGLIIKAESSNIPVTTVIGLLIFGFFAIFSFSDRYQVSFSAKSEKVAKSGMALSIVPLIIVSLILFIVGLFVRLNIPNLDPGLVFIEAMSRFLPDTFLPIAIVLFFAGLMSSADTMIYAVASQYVFWRKTKSPVRDIRIATIVVVCFVSVTSLLFRNIVDITVFGGIFAVISSLPMIYILFSKNKDAFRFLGSFFGGYTGFFIGLFLFGVTPPAIFFPIIGGLLGLFFRKKIVCH